MLKIKINQRSNTVSCSRDNSTESISRCKNCVDCFSIVPYEAVLCKRGVKKDPMFKKSPKKIRKNNLIEI